MWASILCFAVDKKLLSFDDVVNNVVGLGGNVSFVVFVAFIFTSVVVVSATSSLVLILQSLSMNQ